LWGQFDSFLTKESTSPFYGLDFFGQEIVCGRIWVSPWKEAFAVSFYRSTCQVSALTSAAGSGRCVVAVLVIGCIEDDV
jgi:hypothetical protein